MADTVLKSEWARRRKAIDARDANRSSDFDYIKSGTASRNYIKDYVFSKKQDDNDKKTYAKELGYKKVSAQGQRSATEKTSGKKATKKFVTNKR